MPWCLRAKTILRRRRSSAAADAGLKGRSVKSGSRARETRAGSAGLSALHVAMQRRVSSRALCQIVFPGLGHEELLNARVSARSPPARWTFEDQPPSTALPSGA